MTREVIIGNTTIGGNHPVVVQSMCATRTTDIDATVAQVRQLTQAGAGIIRIAADNQKEADALAEIRRRVHDVCLQSDQLSPSSRPNLSVDLQENYRLAEQVAPHVDKIRYNPGHLYHFQPETPWQDKVRFIANVAREHDCAIRIGVNCGSVDPAKREKYDAHDSVSPMVESALEHAALLDSLDFSRYCVSLKDSDPDLVVEANRRFARQRPDVPLHLGVTEAGMPPEGIVKTQIAMQQLLGDGIGATLRVSLTVPNDRKYLEIEAGRQIIADVAAGRFVSREMLDAGRLQIISCPSCSRVQNGAFVELAQDVREMTQYAAKHPLTIAVMGCRVNGPGETDDADLGLWCGPHHVNLKRRGELLGAFSFDEILPRLKAELDRLIAERG